MKVAIFHPVVRLAIRDYTPEVRFAIGQAIWALQRGDTLTMPLSRPMPAVFSELRVKDRSGAYCVFYLAKRADAVIVFHAFTKKSEKTPQSEIAAGRRHLKELLDE